jgi:ferredoxin-NADP reductase
VTPLRSLAEELIKDGRNVTLIYANRKPADVIFIEEFEAWATDKFKLIIIYSQGSVPQHVDEKLINIVAPNLSDYEVYVCGPKPMMTAMREICEKNKLPKNQYHWEKFSF